MINVVQSDDVYIITFRYDPNVVALVKNVPGRKWVPEHKYWTIPKDNLGMLINQFKGTEYEGSITIKSNEQLGVNATIDSTMQIPNIDISKIPFYVKEGAYPFKHQLDFMKFAIDRERNKLMSGFILADEQGCISGDAIIQLNFRGKHRKITLAELYKHWSSHPQYHTMGSYKVRCLKDGKFGLYDVKDVVYSGIKPVYRLKLENGYEIKLTLDHPVLTDAGYVPAGKLTLGSLVLTNGTNVCKLCGTTQNIISNKYSKYIGYCRSCMYKLRSLEHTAEYIEHVDKDGYIICRGKSIDASKHRQVNASGYYYKHRVIMEDYLGRPLKADEIVHHIDGNRQNNDISNLELTNIYDHHRIYHNETDKLVGHDYISRYGNEIVVIPRASKVISFEYVGELQTYDIKMHEPYHNFIANGIVVHNCGKSCEVMNLALFNRKTLKYKHCLIICCISNSRYNWVQDIYDHTKGAETPYILGTRKRRDGSEVVKNDNTLRLADLQTGHMYGDKKSPKLPYFLLMNIESLRYRIGNSFPIVSEICKLINNGYINMVAIDEIHKNMSPHAIQGKQIIRIKKSTGSKCMWIPMSGTPIINKPTDVYLPLKLIDGHSYNSFYAWCNEFCVYGGYGHHEIIGYKNIPKLKTMLQNNMLRRCKADVLDLPPKIYYTEYVDNTAYQDTLYSKVANEIASQKDNILLGLNPLSKFMRLRQVNGSPELVDLKLTVDDKYFSKVGKLQRLMELLEEIHERNEKVIIYSNWVEPLRTLYKYVSKKYNVCCFTGTMSDDERQKHKKAFQENPKYTVMIGTIAALGTTHTLTAASNIIFYDEPWTPADKEQAEDRCMVKGTKITMPYGFKNIEDIKIGDEVFTPSGRVRKVIDCWQHDEVANLVEIRFYGNPESIILTDNHLVLTSNGWKPAGELKTAKDDVNCDDITACMEIASDDLIIDSIPTGFDYDRDMYFYNNFGKRQLNGRKKPLPEYIELTNDFLFLCGYYLGDGCVSKSDSGAGSQLQLAGNTTTKMDSLLRCKHWFDSTICGTSNLYMADSNDCTLYLTHKLFNNFMADTFGRKHDEKHFPNWIYSLNRSQLTAFYEGLCASDGYLDTGKRSTTQQWFVTVTPALASGVWWVMSRLGYKPRIEVREPQNPKNKKIYNIQCTVDPTYKLKTGRIRSIRKYTEQITLYDIAVDTDESFYSWGTPLHNCHRIGTTQPLSIYTLISKGTIDDRVHDILYTKRGISSYIVDNKLDIKNNPQLFDLLLKRS